MSDNQKMKDDYEARLQMLEARIVEMQAAALARESERRTTFKTQVEKYGLIVAWIVLIIIFGIALPNSFFTWLNFATIFSSQAVLVVLTLGLIIPLTAGDLDLSVASTMTLSAMTVAILSAQSGWHIFPTMLAALAVGAAIGLVNAAFIVYFRIHSLIVTLGTGYFISGIVLWVSDSATIAGVSSDLVEWVILTRLFGVSMSFYYALILCIAIWYFFEYTSAGRRLLFVGRGREVARLSGIRVDQVRTFSLVASGMIAAMAGIMYAGTTGSADPSSGLQLLLPAFAAAFLGATSIIPGRFNPFGSMIGVFFLVSGITGLTILGIDSFVQNLFYGGGLVIAVALSQLVRNRQPQEFS